MPETTIKHTYQLKRGEEFTLQRLNPLLRKGEPIVVYCKDGKTNIKIGDGIHNYNDLEFISSDLKLLPPDYKQNDNTQPDYINNRPFYVTGNLETLVENKAIILSEIVDKLTEQDKFINLDIGCKYEVDINIRYNDETYNINIPEIICFEANSLLGIDESVPSLFSIHENIEQAFINEFPGVASLPYSKNPYIHFAICNNFYSVYNDSKSAYNIVIFDNDGNIVTNASHNIETYITIKKDTRQLIVDNTYNKLFEKDFEENDPFSRKYINNRPIYKKYVTTPISQIYKDSCKVQQFDSVLVIESPHSLELVEGNTYIVNYVDLDGNTTSIPCICKNIDVYDDTFTVLQDANYGDLLAINNAYFSIASNSGFECKQNCCSIFSLLEWNPISILIEGIESDKTYQRPVYHKLSQQYIDVDNKVNRESNRLITSAGVWQYVEEGNHELVNWVNRSIDSHDSNDSAHPHLQNNINVLQSKIDNIPKLKTGFIVDETNAIIKESNALIESNGGQLITYIPPTDIIDGTPGKYLHVYNETVNKTTYTRVKIILNSMSKFTEDVINHIETFRYIQLKFANENNTYYLKFDGIDSPNSSYLSLNFSFIDDNRFTVSSSDANREISDLILFNNVGENSHSENSSDALGKDSHAEGTGTIAKGESQHTQGRFNVIDEENKYAHIVGNGTDDKNRSNAYTLDWEGNAEYKGAVKSSDIILKQDDNTEVSLKEGLQTLADAIKEVNGIKYITENFDAWNLDYGVYIIADPYPMVTLEQSYGKFVNVGTLIISGGLGCYKVITFIGENSEDCEPCTVQFYVNELGEIVKGREFIDKNYVDKQIAALQAQIDSINTTQAEVVEDYEQASELLGGNEE